MSRKDSRKQSVYRISLKNRIIQDLTNEKYQLNISYNEQKKKNRNILKNYNNILESFREIKEESIKMKKHINSNDELISENKKLRSMLENISKNDNMLNVSSIPNIRLINLGHGTNEDNKSKTVEREIFYFCKKTGNSNKRMRNKIKIFTRICDRIEHKDEWFGICANQDDMRRMYADLERESKITIDNYEYVKIGENLIQQKNISTETIRIVFKINKKVKIFDRFNKFRFHENSLPVELFEENNKVFDYTSLLGSFIIEKFMRKYPNGEHYGFNSCTFKNDNFARLIENEIVEINYKDIRYISIVSQSKLDIFIRNAQTRYQSDPILVFHGTSLKNGNQLPSKYGLPAWNSVLDGLIKHGPSSMFSNSHYKQLLGTGVYVTDSPVLAHTFTTSGQGLNGYRCLVICITFLGNYLNTNTSMIDQIGLPLEYDSIIYAYSQGCDPIHIEQNEAIRPRSLIIKVDDKLILPVGFLFYKYKKIN